MNKILRHIAASYLARAVASVLSAGVSVGCFLQGYTLMGILFLLLLLFLLYKQQVFYRMHTRKVLFLLDAIANNDYSVHYPEAEDATGNSLVNHALNRVAEILYNVKTETVQQEKYYELILNCINTGIIVINNEGVVYQKNDEALRLLGLEILTHIKQIAQIDSRLADLLSACRSEDKLQFKITGECGTANLSIRVSGITVRKEYLRIIAFNDINTELDEKEIDSWIRLTRVLTHEIMNSITPITSLSETLLSRLNAQQQYSRDTLQPQPDTISPSTPEDTEILRSGLQAISTTGKGLLDFVENYRRFTRIPTPTPSIFYVRELIDRMVGLTRHQNPDLDIRFQVDIRPDDLMLHADESLISQVLINILKNAVQAIATIPHHEGVITIRAYCDEVEDILIEVSNNGPTIPSEIADHIFIPFFTTKDGGSGIGLSISRQIMRISGGSLTLRPGDGTTFVLKLH